MLSSTSAPFLIYKYFATSIDDIDATIIAGKNHGFENISTVITSEKQTIKNDAKIKCVFLDATIFTCVWQLGHLINSSLYLYHGTLFSELLSSFSDLILNEQLGHFMGFIFTHNDLSKGQPKTCGARLLVVQMSKANGLMCLLGVYS